MTIIYMCFHQADDKSPVSTGGSVAYWLVEDLTEALDLFVNSEKLLNI